VERVGWSGRSEGEIKAVGRRLRQRRHVGYGANASGPLWLIGKLVGSLPVALAYAHATAAFAAATPNSPAPPGFPVVGGMTMTCTWGGVFHSRV